MNYTHIYCPECNTYYDKLRSVCRHIYYIGNNIYGGEFVNIKDNKIKRVKSNNYKLFKKADKADKIYISIENGIKQSQNYYFEGITVCIKRCRNAKDVGIIPKREEHPFSIQYNDPTGIKSALLMVTMHEINELPLCDGILNLYSRKIKFRIGDVKITEKQLKKLEVYSAVWVKEGRALYTDYNTEKGWIAKLYGRTYHSTKSINHAIKGVLRKIQKEKKLKRLQKERVFKKAKDEKDFLESIPKDMKIGVSDSLNAGNCESGTMLFVIRHGLKKNKKYNAKEIFKLEPHNDRLKKVIQFKMLREQKKNNYDLVR